MEHRPKVFILLSMLTACGRPPATPATVDSTPAIAVTDTTPPPNGALAGPIGQLGITSHVVPRDESDSGRRIDEFSMDADDGEDGGLPLRVLITDPEGRRTGRRPGWDSAVNEVPRTQYFPPMEPDAPERERFEASPVFMIFSPMPGRYLVELSEVRVGRYFLSFRIQRVNGNVFGPGGWNCASAPPRVDSIWLEVRADTVIFDGPCADPMK